MKLKKLKIKKNTLLKLYIFKNYKRISTNYFNEYCSNLELELKYLLKIIYEYHVESKLSILFINFGHYNKKKISKSKNVNNYIFISKNSIKNGLLSNNLKTKLTKFQTWYNILPTITGKTTTTTKVTNSTDSLSNKIFDMILIFDVKLSDKNFITELINLNKIIIIFGYESKLENYLNNNFIFKFGKDLSSLQLNFYKNLVTYILKNL